MAVDEAGKARAELRRALADWLSLEFIIRGRRGAGRGSLGPGQECGSHTPRSLSLGQRRCRSEDRRVGGGAVAASHPLPTFLTSKSHHNDVPVDLTSWTLPGLAGWTP